jgi:hypothetical protein
LEADLMKDGLRLRDCPSERFNWRDLSVYVRHVGVDSNLFRAMFPDRAGWTLTNMLLAEMVDTLHWLQWAKTKDGQRGRNRPALTPRPGVAPAGKSRKTKAAPLSVIKDRMARRYGRDADPDRPAKLTTLFDGR